MEDGGTHGDLPTLTFAGALGSFVLTFVYLVAVYWWVDHRYAHLGRRVSLLRHAGIVAGLTVLVMLLSGQAFFATMLGGGVLILGVVGNLAAGRVPGSFPPRDEAPQP